MNSDQDLEHGVSQQRADLKTTSISLRDENQKTISMPTNPEAGDISNTLRSDSVMTTVFTFDKNGKRCVQKQPETDEASPSLPCLKIVLRQLNARRFDNELSSNEKDLNFATAGKVQENMNSDPEVNKILRKFGLGLVMRNTNKVPAPPCLGIWELFELWKQDGNDWFWTNNPIFGGAKLEMEVLNEPRLLDRSHMLYLTKYGSTFYILPSAMGMKNLSEELLQVECKFLTWPGNLPSASYLPLLTKFQNLLESEESAIALFDGNMQLGAKLVSLDMLRATIECWYKFLTLIRKQSITSDFKPDSYQLQHDMQHIREFTQIVRDIGEATEATLTAIADFHEIVPDRRRRYHIIIHETRWKLSAMKDVIKDVQSYYDNLMHFQDSAQSIAQASSLKRLTIFASVFLPISLASSLLSMSTRAVTLGVLWYDFFGVSFVLGFIMYAVYQVFRNVAKLSVDGDIVGNLRLLWNFCWRVLLMKKNEESEKKRIKRQQSVEQGKISAEEAEREAQEEKRKEEQMEESQDKLRILLHIAKSTALWTFHIFGTIATASFLVGMFKDVPTGLRMFGYGAAGSLACGILLVLPIKMINGVLDMKIGTKEAFEWGWHLMRGSS